MVRHSLVVSVAMFAIPVAALLNFATAADLPVEATVQDSPEELDKYYIAQPAPAAPSLSTTTAPTASSAARSARSQYVRLARAPNMFGDSLNPGGNLLLQTIGQTGQREQLMLDLPLGSGSNSKIAENNKALPMDRIYFVYNGFQNALQSVRAADPGPIPGPGPGPMVTDRNVDRYTLGFEKTFFDGTASLEIRMPFVGGYNDAAGDAFAISSGNVGNLTMFTKQVLYSDEEIVLAGGVGIGLPTASNLDGRINFLPLQISNNSVHLLPYVGFLTMPSDNCFVQGFLELDFAASGNEIQIGDRVVGTYTPQNLFHVNLSIGHWIHQNPNAKYLQSIAAIGELHYATTIQNADGVPLFGPGFDGALTNLDNRVDYLNMTAGLQFQIGPLANLRVSCVVPLKDAPDRQFDAEPQVSFNRFF